VRKIGFFLLLLLPCLAIAEAPDNWANYWHRLTPGEKIAYLRGYKEGVTTAATEAVSSARYSPAYSGDTPINEIVPSLEIYMVKDIDILSKVISNLYEDPANSYIQIKDMILVAKDRVLGKSTESTLQSARSKALRAHEFKRKIINENK